MNFSLLTKAVFLSSLFFNSECFGSTHNDGITDMDFQTSIKTWASDSAIEKDPGIVKIQKFIALEKDFIRPIQNSPGDNHHYGISFQPLPGSQIPFLQECRSSSTPKNVIEIGSAEGKMVWKILLTGANVWANELSSKEIGYLGAMIKSHAQSYSKNLTVLPGDCLEILKQHSKLRGTFDELYSQNVLHFFGPNRCHLFAQLVFDLLKPGGKASITVDAIQGHDDPTFKQFLCNKINLHKEFPGILAHTVTETQLLGNTVNQQGVLTDVLDNEEPDMRVVKETVEGDITTITKRAVGHYFDHLVLEALFAQHQLLKTDDFYMDSNGSRLKGPEKGVSKYVTITLLKK